jgi:hypothetical protein
MTETKKLINHLNSLIVIDMDSTLKEVSLLLRERNKAAKDIIMTESTIQLYDKTQELKEINLKIQNLLKV